MPNINIDYEAVRGKLTELKNKVSTTEQAELENYYGEAANAIEEYKGEQAESLRELGQSEKELMLELCEFLQKFEDSIQFISDELQNLDETGAAHIAAQERGYK